MERRRIPVGPLLAALGAIALIVSLFLDWYDEVTAWTVFEVLDLVLGGLALATVLVLARQLGYPRRGGLRAGALLPLSALAFVIVVSQVLNHPPAGNEADKEVGIWIALAATAVMLAGALLAAVRVSLSLDVERRESDPTAPTVAQPPTEPRA